MAEAIQSITASVAAPLRGEKRWAYLERQSSIRLATANEDGSIYLSTLWFVIEDQKIYMVIDAAGRHSDNLRAGRSMAAIVDDGNEFATVAGVRITGTATPVEGDPKRFEHLEGLLREKYWFKGHPFEEAAMLVGKFAGRTYFEVAPDKMIGWDTRETTTPQVTEVHDLPDFLTDRRIS